MGGQCGLLEYPGKRQGAFITPNDNVGRLNAHDETLDGQWCTLIDESQNPFDPVTEGGPDGFKVPDSEASGRDIEDGKCPVRQVKEWPAVRCDAGTDVLPPLPS